MRRKMESETLKKSEPHRYLGSKIPDNSTLKDRKVNIEPSFLTAPNSRKKRRIEKKEGKAKQEMKRRRELQ